MLCSKCRCEMRIHKSYFKVTGDQSPDAQTQVIQVQELICKNPQCSEYSQNGENATEVAHVVYAQE